MCTYLHEHMSFESHRHAQQRSHVGLLPCRQLCGCEEQPQVLHGTILHSGIRNVKNVIQEYEKMAETGGTCIGAWRRDGHRGVMDMHRGMEA